jgi:hypothetical protein
MQRKIFLLTIFIIGVSFVLFSNLSALRISNSNATLTKIESDPNSWGATPDVTWVKLNNGVLAANHAYRSLTGRRAGGATQIVVASGLTSGTGNGVQPSLGGSIPGSGSVFRACVYRSLNAHTNTPTWDAISGPSNLLSGGTLRPMYGTADELWVISRATQDNNPNRPKNSHKPQLSKFFFVEKP